MGTCPPYSRCAIDFEICSRRCNSYVISDGDYYEEVKECNDGYVCLDSVCRMTCAGSTDCGTGVCRLGLCTNAAKCTVSISVYV